MINQKLDASDTLHLLRVDQFGVLTHYVISKLYETIVCLGEKRKGTEVSMINLFYNKVTNTLFDEWRILLRVLYLGGSVDSFAQRGAAIILANILISGCPSQRDSKSSRRIEFVSIEEPLQALVSWITSQLQSSMSSSLFLVTPTLITISTCPESRLIFARNSGVGYLTRHLRNRTNLRVQKKGKKNQPSSQQVYELCFCLWTLTYECNNDPMIRAAFHRDRVVNTLVGLLHSAPREKVIRVTLAALQNLAFCDATTHPDLEGRKVIDGEFFLNEMIGCHMMKAIELLNERQWSDPDIIQDLKSLQSLLQENYKERTRWELYQAEIESGNLEWSILHCEQFFKENVKLFESKANDFYLLKLLLTLVSSDDEEVAAIACFDIGEFVRHYPNGRLIAKRLGAKDIIMDLIEHEDADLQRHALQCVSKIMVQNWSAI